MPDKVSMTRYNQAPRFFGKGRTRFDLSHSILTTGNTGDLIVTLCEPIVPGSTMSLKTASLTRLETSLHQTLDNAYVETAYFFIPSRCLWTNFDKYQGYNKDAWAQTLEFKKPQFYLRSQFEQNVDPGLYPYVFPHSLVNDLFAPIGKYKYDVGDSIDLDPTKSFHVDLLPLRGVFKIYNEYFRDQNYDSEIYYDDGDENGCIWLDSAQNNVAHAYLFNGEYFAPAHGRLKVNRFKDLLSTALPQPQKGDPVSVLLNDSAPVGYVPDASGTTASAIGFQYPTGTSLTKDSFIQVKSNSAGGVTGLTSNLGMIADLSGVNFTVNDLRIAIALQSMRERDARSGNRLNEKLYGTWHIQANSLELDRAEYLGGKRIPVSMMEVLQTSETGATVLGSDAGHSKTFDSDDSFVRTFTQWGYVIGFIWVRTSRSYSQGIDRKFFVEDVLDEYDPMLDSIGEQPVFKKELNAVMGVNADGTFNNGGNTVVKGDKVWGYQEPWYQYKERLNRFYGMFQPGIDGSLDSWHYGDKYFNVQDLSVEPFIGPSWLKEGPENVDRTIAVASGASLASFQWKFNLHFELFNTFEASKKSIPNTFGF